MQKERRSRSKLAQKDVQGHTLGYSILGKCQSRLAIISPILIARSSMGILFTSK